MPLTKEEVKKIAYLARMKISSDEIALYQEQLSAILDYASRLQKLDTSNIKGTAQITGPGVELRQDIPRPGLTPEEVFDNSSDERDHQFRIPPVFD
jgi:aspartyl-tRNA(Asn)/glutamyl-tRNA(Gln) amidotransferase subunit C